MKYDKHHDKSIKMCSGTMQLATKHFEMRYFTALHQS